MIILPFIPILALLVQTSFSLYDILQYLGEVNEIESQVNIVVVIPLFFGGQKWFFPSSKLMNEIIFLTSPHPTALLALDSSLGGDGDWFGKSGDTLAAGARGGRFLHLHERQHDELESDSALPTDWWSH